VIDLYYKDWTNVFGVALSDGEGVSRFPDFSPAFGGAPPGVKLTIFISFDYAWPREELLDSISLTHLIMIAYVRGKNACRPHPAKSLSQG
jgi:hypothetical protein